jgi:paraquat-inducible protein A
LETVACPGCDLLQRIPQLSPGAVARCPRCLEVLATEPSDPLDHPLALSIAAATVFVVANTSPLMSLSAVGRGASTTILGGAQEMWLQGSETTAVMVAFSAVVAPAIYIAFMLVLLVAARREPVPNWVGELLRWVVHVRPWSMNEVMMLGILVAQIKIAQLATVVVGTGLYAVGVLVLLLAWLAATFEPREVWRRVAWVDASVRSPVSAPLRAPRAGA